jgi:outer membrane receptor for ferrienterochelin and colicins
MIEQNVTVRTPDFWDMGFKAAYNFKLYKSFNLEVNAGVQNILNSFQNDFDSGYMYGPTLPRTFFLGVKLAY